MCILSFVLRLLLIVLKGKGVEASTLDIVSAKLGWWERKNSPFKCLLSNFMQKNSLLTEKK